jgi:hypothetical protein
MSQEMSVEEAVKEYKQLIRSLPPVNQYLLLYVLDLLSVFAKKAEVNLMNAPSELNASGLIRSRSHFPTRRSLPPYA